MGFLSKIQSRLEIYRLEKRYTRNRHRRSTFISNAQYVDGEYVYQTPTATGSSTNSSTVSTPTGTETERRSLEMPTVPEDPEQSTPPPRQKRLPRLASMPGFGSKDSRSNW
ncbi:hypothetical protein F4808DRAFT_454548 [Astrocystis sublimbata]|nr:hypothetical protein F4808DRAFT_454548 [Astrocystis sublimbata]